MTGLFVTLVIWIIFGIFAYGLLKNDWRQFYEKYEYVGHNFAIEFQCIFYGLMGPIGLISFFLVYYFLLPPLYVAKNIGLCYRMPGELRKPREAEVKLEKAERKLKEMLNRSDEDLPE